MDDATRARLESIRDYADMSHSYRQAVGDILTAYDALRAAQAQAAPVLAASDIYERAKGLGHCYHRELARDVWVAAVRAWRAAREG